MSNAYLLAPAFSQNLTGASGLRGSERNCADMEQSMRSQWYQVHSNPETTLMFLNAEYGCNQRAEARRLAGVLREHSEDSSWSDAIFRAGQIASAANDFETAEALLKVIEKNYSNSAALYFELGSVQLQSGKFEQAKESCQRAAQLDPSSPDIQLTLAGARALSGYGEDALSGLEQNIQRFRDDVRFLIAYADVLQQLPEYAEAGYKSRAKRYLERAIAMDRTSGRAYYLLGQLLISESNFQDAIQPLKRAVEYQPDSSQAHFALSRAYRRVGRVSDADEEFSLFAKLSGQAR